MKLVIACFALVMLAGCGPVVMGTRIERVNQEAFVVGKTTIATVESAYGENCPNVIPNSVAATAKNVTGCVLIERDPSSAQLIYREQSTLSSPGNPDLSAYRSVTYRFKDGVLSEPPSFRESCDMEAGIISVPDECRANELLPHSPPVASSVR